MLVTIARLLPSLVAIVIVLAAVAALALAGGAEIRLPL